MKGVPVRLAIGARDLDAGTVEAARRDTKQKLQLPLAEVVDSVDKLLNDIQFAIYEKAKAYRDAHTTYVETYDEFKTVLRHHGRLRGGALRWHFRNRGANQGADQSHRALPTPERSR